MNRPLDRERIPEYRLTISVKDNPENPRIARRVRLVARGGAGGSRAGCQGHMGSRARGVNAKALE